VVGSSAFKPITVVVGNICKLAVEALHFTCGCIFFDFELPGNLKNTVT
jgi:hypothetical protein